MDQDNQKKPPSRHRAVVGVLLAWQMVLCRPEAGRDQERRQRVQQEQGQLKSSRRRETAPGTAPGAASQPGAAVPSAAPASPALTRERGVQRPRACASKTPSLRARLRWQAAARRLVLAKYHETVDPTSPNSCCSRRRARRTPTTRNTDGRRATA